MSDAIRVRVNGEERELQRDTSIASLLLGVDELLGAAVARNREVVPRLQWALTFLHDGDEVEIVRPVQGGAW
ncbi:MAG: sulfur carrier protein ThiS [Chloroflexi bacterium]|nr:MAG: sulfur carrier protein ThiS [Chloroflexota bacterium]